MTPPATYRDVFPGGSGELAGESPPLVYVREVCISFLGGELCTIANV